MFDPSIPALVTAFTGLVVAAGSLWLNFRGRQDQNRQAAAASRALEDKNALDESKQINDQLSAHNERLIARSEKAEAAADTAREDLDEERTLRRHMLSVQEARCREVQGSLVETLVVLRSVVNDEIARSAADKALAAPTHPHELPAPQVVTPPDAGPAPTV